MVLLATYYLGYVILYIIQHIFPFLVVMGNKCGKCQTHARCEADNCGVHRCRCKLGYAPNPSNTECWKCKSIVGYQLFTIFMYCGVWGFVLGHCLVMRFLMGRERAGCSTLVWWLTVFLSLCRGAMCLSSGTYFLTNYGCNVA